MKLPDRINLDYLRQLNPASAAAANVASTVNQLIEYLEHIQPALNKAVEAANEVDSLEKQYKTSSDS